MVFFVEDTVSIRDAGFEIFPRDSKIRISEKFFVLRYENVR